MSDIKIRLGVLIEMRRKHLVQLRANITKSENDKNGSATNSLVGTLRFIAVADYVLNKDIFGYKSALTEAASLRCKLFKRFDTGEAISPSYVSMRTYKSLFNALAAGDEVLSKEFASQMGGRDKIESEYDRPFDIAFGYLLKAFLESDKAKVSRYLDALESLSIEPENVDFKGYAIVLRAVSIGDVGAAEKGFGEVFIGHKRQCNAGGLFKYTEDEMLCIWGIGLANLARMCGLAIYIKDSFIPDELLMPVVNH